MLSQVHLCRDSSVGSSASLKMRRFVGPIPTLGAWRVYSLMAGQLSHKEDRFGSTPNTPTFYASGGMGNALDFDSRSFLRSNRRRRAVGL